MLFCFIVLLHDRRRVIHFNVTVHPTAEWTAQQIREAFPEETAPRFLLRDWDQIYGEYFRSRVKALGDRRNHHCTAFTLAKSIRRAADGDDPLGVSRPCNRAE